MRNRKILHLLILALGSVVFVASSQAAFAGCGVNSVGDHGCKGEAKSYGYSIRSGSSSGRTALFLGGASPGSGGGVVLGGDSIAGVLGGSASSTGSSASGGSVITGIKEVSPGGVSDLADSLTGGGGKGDSVITGIKEVSSGDIGDLMDSAGSDVGDLLLSEGEDHVSDLATTALDQLPDSGLGGKVKDKVSAEDVTDQLMDLYQQ